MEECKGFRDQLSLYIDGMLTEKESQLLEKHINLCEGCRMELEMLQEMVENCQSLEDKEPPKYLNFMISSAVRKAQRESTANKIRRKWLKPGLVSVAAILLLAIAATGIMPYLLMGSKTGYDMATNGTAPAEAPTEEMYGAAGDGELGLKADQPSYNVASGTMDAHGPETDIDDSVMQEQGEPYSIAIAPDETAQVRTFSATEATDQDSRKIIRNAEVSLEVESFDRQFEAIRVMVEDAGGYIESSNSYVRKHGNTEDERDFIEGHVVIRIPSLEFTSCLERVSNLGKVTNRSTDGSDITLKYMDTQSRLQSLQVQQQRLLEILERGTKVEDILNIENELNRVRTELEKHATQLKGWDNLVQYSTIRIFMTEVDPKDTHVSTLQVGSLWDRMKRGFIRTTNAIMDMIEYIIVGVGYALPVVVLAGAGYLVWTRFINRKNVE